MKKSAESHANNTIKHISTHIMRSALSQETVSGRLVIVQVVEYEDIPRPSHRNNCLIGRVQQEADGGRHRWVLLEFGTI